LTKFTPPFYHKGMNQPVWESRRVYVYPDKHLEQYTIDQHKKCGWQLVSYQRVDERCDGNTVTSSRMEFTRDKNMPHYDEIKKLSKRALMNVGTVPYKSPIPALARALIILGQILLLLYGLTRLLAGETVLFFLRGGIISAATGAVVCLVIVFKNRERRQLHNYVAEVAKKAADECQRILKSD